MAGFEATLGSIHIPRSLAPVEVVDPESKSRLVLLDIVGTRPL